MKRMVAMMLLVGFCAACSNTQKPTEGAKTDLTRRQKDSVLGESKVPGAPAVKKAMTAADSSSAKAADFNALQDTIH